MSGRPKDLNSVYQRALALGIHPNTVYGRIKRKHWDIERSLTTPAKPQSRVLSRRAADAGIRLDTVRSRLRRGWDVEKAISYPVDESCRTHGRHVERPIGMLPR
jgi:hypothetical protein